MKDRFYNGFISGVFGGLVSFIVNFGSRVLGLNKLIWADYMSLIIMGRKPEGTIELVFFVIAEFAFLGILGAIFAHIVPNISSERLAFKGAIYGTAIWFILFSIPKLLKLPEFGSMLFNTVLFNLIASFFWGMSMAVVLKKIDERVDS